MLTYFAGLAMMASLIIALGAQNVFVLRQGAQRDRVTLVVTICIFSDIALVALGVAGLGSLIAEYPWLLTAVLWCGVVFLAVYGIIAARRALRPSPNVYVVQSEEVSTSETSTTARSTSTTTQSALLPTILATLGFTWLNPGVYLDTVFLVGSVAATHGDERWIFALGAMTASALWFSALGYGSRYIGRWLRTPRSWRILDGLIAVIMGIMALSLALR